MSHTHFLASSQARTTNHRPRTLLFAGVLVVALLAGIGIGLVARGWGSSSRADADRVREVDRTLRVALVAADIGTIDRILAPGHQLVTPPGDRDTHDRYLGDLTSGQLKYHTFDAITPVDVRISGDLAVVTYESQLDVTAGLYHVQHKGWNTHVYEKQDGQWRQVWSQVTAVGGFPPPGS